GYFRAIRQDFPEQFEALCQVQDELGEGSYLFRDRATNVRFSLRDLGDGPVRRNEKSRLVRFSARWPRPISLRRIIHDA
ncbi:MAG: hypothetical protein ACRESN_08965, partial [Pseudomonas sp.]